MDMGRITEADYYAMQARLRAKERVPVDEEAISREQRLHEQILTECHARRWLVIHSRMDRPTTTAKGVPDFVILADNGRLFLVEAKARQGKLSIAQLAFGIQCEYLGHKVHLVRSLANFIDAVNETKP
jgi:hypothetical protein